MKSKMRKISCSSLLILIISSVPMIAQTSDQMIRMVKNMIQQFEETSAEDVGMDEPMNEGASFDPAISLSTKNSYSIALNDPEKMFSLTDYQNGYTVLDEKELPTNSIELRFSFNDLPGFTALNVWYDIASIKDAKGKHVLLAEKAVEKYREYGIIDDGYNFPVPGEFSLRQWLNRELEYDEVLRIAGTIGLEYPADYNSVVFGKEDTGEVKTVGSTTITLIEIDRNMVTLVMKGNRNEIEGLTMIILDSDGKIFTSTSSIAIDLKMYDTDTKSVREFSDDEIAATVNNFDMSSLEAEQVKKIKVFGNIHQIVFMEINSYEHMEVPFEIAIPFTGF